MPNKCKNRVSEERRALIVKYANANGLDPDFVEAIAIQEGGLSFPDGGEKPDPSNTRDGIAHGFMQVHVGAAEMGGWKGTNPSELNSDENTVKYGAAYLRRSGDIAKCGDDLYCRASAYNGGPGFGHTGPDKTPNPRAVQYGIAVVEHYNCIKNGEGKPVAPLPQPKPPASPSNGGGSIPCDVMNPEAEAIIPFPMPSNPYFAYFTLNVAGLNLTPTRPQYVTYYEFVEEMGVATSCRVRVFDPNWDVISGALLGDEIRRDWVPDPMANCWTSWGYTDRNLEAITPAGPRSLWSNPHTLKLLTFRPEFLGWGVEIEVTMVGFDSSSSNGGEKGRTLWGTIASGDNDNPGIAEALIQESGSVPCTEKTRDINDYGSGLDSVQPESRIWSQDHVDNYVMMKNQLQPMATYDAISGTDGEANVGYYVLRHNTDHGVTCFHPYLIDSNHVREYVYARQQYGAIISWKPDINEALVAALAASGAKADTFDMVRKDFSTTIVDSVTAPNRLVTGPETKANFEGVHDEELRKNVPTAQPAKNGTWAEMLNHFESARMAAMTGTLTVIGDPLIKPGRNVSILVHTFYVKPDGTVVPVLHWTSGVWMIQRTQHIIQAGEYITVLTLFRTDVLTQSKQSGEGNRQDSNTTAATRFSTTYANNFITR